MTDAETRGHIDATIDAFLARLGQGGGDFDELLPPANAAAIEATERALDVPLPPSFKQFLLTHNGGCAYDTSIYSVAGEKGYDLTLLNLKGRDDGFPDHLIGFAATIQGDVYVFDSSAAAERSEWPVGLVDVKQGELIPATRTFLEWLERLPTLETELTEERGPQPMTVEEWEAFLVRERAKLRRLSKTPAREMTMPDPEAVRAELGGKIPVDPRHLKKR